jgi:hypothetical protein
MIKPGSTKPSQTDENKKQHVPFISHCAPIAIQQRLEQGAEKITVAELRSVIVQIIESNGYNDDILMPPKNGKKSVLVELLNGLRARQNTNMTLPPPSVSAQEAAREKAKSGENRAVEHVAELSSEQAIKAISVTPSPAVPGKKKSSGQTPGKKNSTKREGNTSDCGLKAGKRRQSSPRRLRYGE